MKSILIASALFAVAFAAQAQSGASVTVKDDAAPTADTPQVVPNEIVVADLKRDELADHSCLRETGSIILARSNARLPKDKQKCAAANGRSYSRDDIDRTGTTDLAEALRRLDPSIH